MEELIVDTDLTATLNQIDSLISDQSTDGVIAVGDIFNTPLQESKFTTLGDKIS
jgi:hypothetical protein